jgi:hypothetical protein
MLAALIRLDAEFYQEMGEFLRQYQTLLVGGLGFTGVVATLAMNAWLTRRQHDRQVQHEARVLRTALRAELEVIREAFRDRIQTIDSTKPGAGKSMLVPLETMSDVYASLIDRVGLLSETETRAVVRAYVLVRQMPERLKMLMRKQGTEEEVESGWALIGSELFVALRKMHENYLTDVDAALEEIARH